MMMTSARVVTQAKLGALPVTLPTRTRDRCRRLCVRASDDEDMVPIFSGRRKKGFSAKEYEQLRNPQLLGGKTIGEELELLRKQYVSSEETASNQVQSDLISDNWQGDVYVGSRWNTLSVLYLIMLVSIGGIGLFAWMSYGTMWGVTPGLR